MGTHILGLTFTYGMSLDDWVDKGLLDREKLIYEEHIRRGHFNRIVWFTYGRNDQSIRDKLVAQGRLDDHIDVIGAPKWVNGRFSKLIYSVVLPHVIDVKNLSIIKSNQMGGARVAHAISKRFSIPFVLRTGYTYTLFQKKELDEKVMSVYKRLKKKLILAYYTQVERLLYKKCDLAEVSSYGDRDYIVSTYRIPENKIVLLTNYVDTDAFDDRTPILNRENRFLFVGRLSMQKNLINLVKAAKESSVGLDVYGDGEQKEEIERIINDLDADVHLLGLVNNSELPRIYNSYKYYILPSLYEGMPKTLLEAMACGCICLGTNVEGIKEVIADGDNGYIIFEMGARSIAETIKKVLKKSVEPEIIRCSTKAKQFIREKHSLRTITENEWGIVSCLIQ